MIFWFKDNINPVDSTEAQGDTDSNHDSDEESGDEHCRRDAFFKWTDFIFLILFQ